SRVLFTQQRGEIVNVTSADMPLVGTRVHRDAVRACRDHEPCGVRDARITDVPLISEQRHLVEVDAELRIYALIHSLHSQTALVAGRDGAAVGAAAQGW